MPHKYVQPKFNRGLWEKIKGPGQDTLFFEEATQKESLNRHIWLIENDIKGFRRQIEDRLAELKYYSQHLLYELEKKVCPGMKYGRVDQFQRYKYPPPEHVHLAMLELQRTSESYLGSLFKSLNDSIEEYKKFFANHDLAHEALRYEGVIKRATNCIEKTTTEVDAYIQSYVELGELSSAERDRIKKEENKDTNETRAKHRKNTFGNFEQNYVKGSPKPKTKPNSESNKPKKTIGKKTKNSNGLLIPNQVFINAVQQYLLPKDLSKKAKTWPKWLSGTGATKAEIITAWKKLALKTHTDKISHLNSDEKKTAKEMFLAVTTEKERLCPVTSGKGKKAKGKKTKKGKKTIS